MERFFTRTYLPHLVKSSLPCLELKYTQSIIISSLIHHCRARPHMQKPRIKEAHSRPPIFNLNIDVFRELLDYLEPIDQLCLLATCKPFFDLLWPLMQKWVGWNNCTQSGRKHTQEIHHDEIQFLLRSFSWSMCSLGGSGIIFPEYLYRSSYGTKVINDQEQHIMDRAATLRKQKSHVLYPCTCCSGPESMKERPPVVECREGRPVINLFSCHTNDLLDSIELCSSQPWLMHTWKERPLSYDPRRVEATAFFYLAVSTRTKRSGLLLYVYHTVWVHGSFETVVICPHKWVTERYSLLPPLPKVYIDTPCATSFVTGPSCESRGFGWSVKFSTARFLRLF